MSEENYLEMVVREFSRLKQLADGAMAQVLDDGFVNAAFESDTSIAIIVKHMSGNMHSRWRGFLTTDGEKPSRNRDSEFEMLAADDREHLLKSWESAWDVFIGTLTSLGAKDLRRNVTIRNEPLTVLQAINRQLTHYSYHVGQIVILAKQQCRGTWKTLSVGKEKSREFNKNPDSYL